MASVIVTVFKNDNGICPEGYEKAVSTNSIIYSVENVNMSLVAPECGQINIDFKLLLKIVDPYLGTLWIDETEDSFAAKIASAINATGKEPYSFPLIVDDVEYPVSQTIVVPELIGKTVLGVSVAGINIYPTNYAFTPGTGTTVFDATNVPIGLNTEIIFQYK